MIQHSFRFRNLVVAWALTLIGAVTQPLTAHAGDASLSRSDALWLDRVTYGLDTATVERFRQLGKRRFLDEQLTVANDTLPASIQAQIDAMDISRQSTEQLFREAVAEQKQIKEMKASDSDEAGKRARMQLNAFGNQLLDETARRQLLRAIYSPAQLEQQMDWFWLNHFNVFARKGAERWLVADYEETAIRPHALGHFHDLVIATLMHPAMQLYLDNARNAVGHINENYARELMELHTLGVDAGYTQADVQALAHVLTGAGIALQHEPPRLRPQLQQLYVRRGLFAFNPARHDFDDKILLGHTIRGQGWPEIEQAVDLLVQQPACAHFISRELAQYFVADDPNPRLVDAMARTFQRSDGDIAAVLRTLFDSPEFAASLGHKFKDPMHYVVSSLRLAYDGKPIANAQPVANWLNGQGEALFGHLTPDGYPLVEAGWASSGQLSRRFEIARAIGAGNATLFQPADGSSAPAAGFPNLSNPVYFAAIQPYLSKQTLTALDQAKSPQEWNAFLLASPDFNYR